MKKIIALLFLLVCCCALMADEFFGPIRPVPTQNIVLKKANDYTDTMCSYLESKVKDTMTYKFEKIAPYLYKTQINEFDWARAAKHYKNVDPVQTGLCSSFRCGKFVGRNLDWTYDETASVVVRTIKGKNVKHSSISVLTGLPGVEEELLSKDQFSEKLFLIGFQAVDGVNDAGVEINHNVVPGPTNKADWITYTNPGKTRLCSSQVVRWILNNADSVSNAVEIIKNEIDIFVPELMHGYDSHWMISDTNKTVVVEIRKGQVIATDVSDRPVMTNFRIEGTSLTNNVLNIDTVEKYAAGTERYNIFLNASKQNLTVDGMINTMKAYPYSLCYDENRVPDPFWYSDYNGNWEDFGELTVKSPTNAYTAIIAHYREQYKFRTRDNPDCWQTVHASVYDLENKILYVIPQESGITYKFELDPYLYK